MIVLVQKLNHKSHPKCKSKSPKTTRLSQSAVPILSLLHESLKHARYNTPGIPGVLKALMQAWLATVDKALEYGVIILRTDAVLVA